MISLIVARSRGGAIGKNGTIPWFAPEDLAFFQRETLGGALIMGRRTWESLPVKTLKRRLNIVVSSSKIDDAKVCANVTSAIDLAYSEGFRRIYGMGGNGIYSELLPLADRLLITEVDLVIENADTFFPDFSEDDWHCTGELVLRGDAPGCVAKEYLRLPGQSPRAQRG